ncbi:MAG: ATP-dependent helicase HrpB [Hyphomicrobium sp. 32-62-53]|nr:MAG: ATP-dependent helicase HrpB [Hyphomicrobium sp. 12-62-95]OYY01078.1 MAG: ATP-dependent helicase HrpB [Hyphomicrobium sp. 32-62-53]
MRFDTPLPIDDVLEDLGAALTARASAVLVAPPGAGKTTRVPLALLDAPWLGPRNKILVLEPRRIAARGAAERMAKTLSERVGEKVGLRARMVSKSGPKTRIEVITEGVFTRIILDDPSLDGIGAVLFDEFHERSLDADLGLALALDTQKALREDLRILVMSATMDGARVASLLDNAPVIESEGRAYPVETRYLGRDANRRIEDQVVDAIGRALRAEPGSLLVFLPGQGEIKRVEERLQNSITDANVILAPLYGAMDMTAQDRAIEPAPAGKRKVVLATAIAETSLTIEGVRVVIDSGLQRVPRFEPDAGVTRLETVRVSRASADQRRGRAGRTEPGVCYRLWDEPQTTSLRPFTEPEIRSADLSGLLLDLAEWGVTDPATLSWLDPPAPSAVTAARAELQTIGALDNDGRITPEGRRVRALPLPPRLARMVLAAQSSEAAELAAILVERGLGGTDTDLDHRLSNFRRDRSRRAEDMRRLAAGWSKTAGATNAAHRTSAANLLALAYPDRIAKARGAPGQFLLANGRGAHLDPADGLARDPYLVVAELQGTAAATRILAAARLSEAELLTIAAGRIVDRDELTFEAAAGAIRARRVRRLDAITLASESRPVTPSSETASLLAQGAATTGIDRLPWSKSQEQLRHRIAFLRSAEGDQWPDLSDAALAQSAQTWLAPFLEHATRLTDIDAAVLGSALDALIPWDLKRKLDTEAPTHFEAPTGNSHPIDYDGPGAPALSIRVQELYGLKDHPAIAGGRLPLTLNLLSPAHRSMQITRDLPGFWAGSWSAVKSEMKGRYPRHLWPDNPANALPTARAKPRGT